MARTDQIRVRVSPEEKALIETNAGGARKISAFLRGLGLNPRGQTPLRSAVRAVGEEDASPVATAGIAAARASGPPALPNAAQLQQRLGIPRATCAHLLERGAVSVVSGRLFVSGRDEGPWT